MVKLVTANELRDDEKLAHCLYDNTGIIGQTFKTEDPEWHTPKHVNTYLVDCLKRYEIYGRIDEELWESYQEDFENWTDDLFALADKKIRTPLRDFLRDNGVCVGGTKYISKQLYNVVQEDAYQEWPAEEVTKQMRTGRDFNSYQNPTFPAKLEESRNTPGPRTTTTPGPAERQCRDSGVWAYFVVTGEMVANCYAQGATVKVRAHSSWIGRYVAAYSDPNPMNADGLKLIAAFVER